MEGQHLPLNLNNTEDSYSLLLASVMPDIVNREPILSFRSDQRERGGGRKYAEVAPSLRRCK